MALANLTKKFIESLPLTAKGQILYFDEELRGFGLCVGMQSKSYFAQHDVNGKSVRVTIGKHGVFTHDEARKSARALLVDMSNGINPIEAKREARIRSQTLKQLYNHFIKQSAQRLAKRTVVNYEDFIEVHFTEWKDRPVAEITKEMIIKKHEYIGVNSGKNAANNAIQFLRALYNFAKIDCEQIENPVVVLSQKKLWYAKERRRSIIKDHQLCAWYKAVMELQNHTARDALCFLLFTGLRKMEALTLRWENVDMNARTFLIVDTKNRQPLELPLCDHLYDILKERKKTAKKNPWVFHGNSKAGHLEDVKKAVAKVKESSGITFMPHDLRRTFTTVAERLDISSYAVKSLINHKTGNNDVTSGYIIMDVERLREPMQKIARYMLDKINFAQPAHP